MLSAYFFPSPRSDSFSSLGSAIHPFVNVSIDPAILAARAASRMAGEGAVIAKLNRSLEALEPGASIDLHPAFEGHANHSAGSSEFSALSKQR